MAFRKSAKRDDGQPFADEANAGTNGHGDEVIDLRSVDGSADGSSDVDASPIAGRLGELLVRRRLVTDAQLAKALLRQNGSGDRLGALLVRTGVLDETTLTDALAEHHGVDVVRLGDERPTPEAIDALEEELARELTALPLRKSDEGLVVAVGDPTIPGLRERLEKGAGQPVVLVLAPASDIVRALNRSYNALSGVQRHVDAFGLAEARRRPTATAAELATNEDAPVVRLVTLMITQAVRDRASDIHIEPQDTEIRVRYRIDGALHDALKVPAEIGPALVSRLKIMGGMNIVERRRSQDGQFTTEIDGRSLDVRVATTATIWGEKCVLRILDKSRSVYRLHELGMPEETEAVYSKLVRVPFGMVLCAGPTGAGKTTTLYATLTEINDPSRNIMTIEDPVEYVFPTINQIQTNEQAGLTFAGGLKAILRQDPDVILVGEIRDVETARIAVQSALTGHFVLSSLHATDTAAALHRFLDMGIESFLIASSVVAVVAQRLVRRICPTCKAPYKPTDEELAFYEDAAGPAKDEFFAGEGCNFCAGTGYQDRIGVYELLRITPEIRRLVVGWATQEELRRMATSQGMRTLRDDGIALVAQDTTTISEVIRCIYAM